MTPSLKLIALLDVIIIIIIIITIFITYVFLRNINYGLLQICC